jgi:hypothetical protein
MAGSIHVLDDYYLAITLIVTVVYQLAFFSVAFSFKFDKLTGSYLSPHMPGRILILLTLSHGYQTSPGGPTLLSLP